MISRTLSRAVCRLSVQRSSFFALRSPQSGYPPTPRLAVRQTLAPSRLYTTGKSSADEKIEQITDQYASTSPRVLEPADRPDTPPPATRSGFPIASALGQSLTEERQFEIAAEETEKKTVYAADDRTAAGEEFAALKELYDAALRDSPEEVATEIKARVGSRIRELDEALKGLEEKAKED